MSFDKSMMQWYPNNEKFYCDKCGEEMDYCDEEECYCDNCLESRIECDICGKLEFEEDIKYTQDGKNVCDSCYSDHYDKCVICGEEYRINEDKDTHACSKHEHMKNRIAIKYTILSIKRKIRRYYFKLKLKRMIKFQGGK